MTGAAAVIVESASSRRERSRSRSPQQGGGKSDVHIVPPRLFSGSACPLIITGAWQLSSGHSAHVAAQERSELVAALKAYAEAGLWCFDCADIYTGVEALLGEVALVSTAPVRLHTKCVPDLDMISAGKVGREYLEAGVLRSAGRLGCEVLDLVQFHWWDYESPGFAEAFACLSTLRDIGLVRSIGLTNTDLPHLRKVVEMGNNVASNQVQLSLLDRRPLDSGMAAFCQDHGIELLCYGALAGGFLTDKWLGKDDPGFDDLENRSLTKYRMIIDEYGTWSDFQRLLRLLSTIATQRNTTVASVAVGWVLRQIGNTRTILGTRGSTHAVSAATALSVPLSKAEVAALDAEVAGKGVKGEVFGAERAGGRHTGVMRRNLNGIATADHAAECVLRARKVLERGASTKTLLREAELLETLGVDCSELREVLNAAAA